MWSGVFCVVSIAVGSCVPIRSQAKKDATEIYCAVHIHIDCYKGNSLESIDILQLVEFSSEHTKRKKKQLYTSCTHLKRIYNNKWSSPTVCDADALNLSQYIYALLFFFIWNEKSRAFYVTHKNDENLFNLMLIKANLFYRFMYSMAAVIVIKFSVGFDR